MKPDAATSKKRGPDKSPRRKAAEAAGLSRSQAWRAIQVASIPKDELEQLIEADNPPTVTELVEIGKEHRGLSRRKQARRLNTSPHCGGDLSEAES